MPTERFFHLSEDKRKRILKAARKEFIRVPFEEVSINQIIKNAEISRGSFYTYFEDKNDLLRYVFQDTKQNYIKKKKKSLVDHKGDFWKMMEDIFEKMVCEPYSSDLAKMLQNIMSYSEAVNILQMGHNDECTGQRIDEWVFEHMDRTGMRRKTAEELKAAMEFGMLAILTAFTQRYKKHMDVSQIRQLFYFKMDILKYGIAERITE